MPVAPIAELHAQISRIFQAVGISPSGSATVATSLLDADRRGITSHGAMLVPMYVDRIRQGSVSTSERASIDMDQGAVACLDAQHALGVFTSDQAMTIAVKKAGQFGVGAVTVKSGFHFGGAFRYVTSAATEGMIGLAAANTRPLMPAVGGAQAVVGNNPLAIAVPRSGGVPIVLDMALSAAALGKIRLAAQEGRSIPTHWATDSAGDPTDDPKAAIDGLLLPSGGHKGFGLALMVDMLTGVLSGGAFGQAVQGLYADTSTPNDCAHFFLALNPTMFGTSDLADRAAQLAVQIAGSTRASGVDRLLLPGELEDERYAATTTDGVRVDAGTLAELDALSADLGVDTSIKTADRSQ